jgi:hypothetical protein
LLIKSPLSRGFTTLYKRSVVVQKPWTIRLGRS